MTLGKKLSNYRKLLGLTQQQLGERLNLSAQAVSKWENDLAEPDLTTLKALAGLYSVSVDELLNTDDDNLHGYGQNSQASATIDAEKVAETVASAIDDKMKETPKTIGFCKNCGITVTNENVGKKSPKVLCKACWDLELEEDIRERQKRVLEVQRYNEKCKFVSNDLRQRRRRSLIWGGLVGIILFVMFVPELFKDFSPATLFCTFVIPYAAMSFVSMLFYDCAVTNVILYMCTATIRFPGLIFTFDLDGFLWMIGMRLLFAGVGFIFGLICSIIGLILGIIIAPFVFPYVMVRFKRDIAMGTESDFVF